MTIHGLAAAGDRVWFADGPELGVVEGGRVRETKGAKVSPAAELSGSPSGDVWTLTGGALARYAVATTGPSWDETVAPVFHRVCEKCHHPGGGTGVTLSSEEAWEKKRARLRQRVLVDRDHAAGRPPAHRRGAGGAAGLDRALSSRPETRDDGIRLAPVLTIW